MADLQRDNSRGQRPQGVPPAQPLDVENAQNNAGGRPGYTHPFETTPYAAPPSHDRTAPMQQPYQAAPQPQPQPQPYGPAAQPGYEHAAAPPYQQQYGPPGYGPPGMPDEGSQRRGMTAALVAVGLAALAVIVGVVMLVSSGDGNTTTDQAAVNGTSAQGASSQNTAETTSASSDDENTRPAPADAITGSATLQSPSGNITCDLSESGARCDVAQRSWKLPPRPSDCTESWGVGAAVTSDGPTLVCSDNKLSNGSAQKAAYGTSYSAGDYACTSSQSGIECWSVKTGKGFKVARATYSLT